MSAVPREVLSAEEILDLDHHEKVVAAHFNRFVEVGSSLLEIRDRRLYRATHDTFETYCEQRWGLKRNRAYQLIDAAHVVSDIKDGLSTIVDIPAPTSEGQVRPLASVEPADRPKVWQEAVEATGGKPTAKAVKAAVEKVVGPKLAKVNGVETVDPPDIAKLRKAGAIPADAVVTIEGDAAAAPDPEADAERAAIASDDVSDAEWLAGLPLSRVLSGHQLRQFHRDALLYRRMEPTRRTYVLVFNREAKALSRQYQGVPTGDYEILTSWWVRLEHPKDWRVCVKPEHGGCDGKGVIGVIGQCPACKGRGYRVRTHD
jgi:hypothetical protein